jgi:hypothetical protein
VLEMLGAPLDAAGNELAAEPDSTFGNLPNQGWDPAQHAELKTKIAAREPFLDFLLCRTRADGEVQRFHISGEPIFSRGSQFIGYRGIGLEIARE